MDNLFQLGNFTLRSGAKSTWRIECDALTSKDWMGLAAIAAEVLPPFTVAYGVPRGGSPFAEAMQMHSRKPSLGLPATNYTILICEDVVTTGGSIERFRESLDIDPSYTVRGVCVFARGICPPWITPLFQMPVPTVPRKP